MIEQKDAKTKMKEKIMAMPEKKVSLSLSKDGKWFIVKVTETKIFSKKYLDKVLEGKEFKEVDVEDVF